METTEGKIQWHPLVKTLAAARLTPQQHKVCFVYRLMKGRPYEREESGHVPIFTGPDHGIDLKLFTRSFSGEYLRAITKIYLDGTSITLTPVDKAQIA